jgi:hypothetical protein
VSRARIATWVGVFRRGIDQGGRRPRHKVSICRLSLCTVPVPSPVSFAVLMMPVPFANSWRAQSSFSASAPGLPNLFRPSPALLTNFAVALDLGLDDAQAGPDALADHRAFELGEAPRPNQIDRRGGSCRSQSDLCRRRRLTRYRSRGRRSRLPYRLAATTLTLRSLRALQCGA